MTGRVYNKRIEEYAMLKPAKMRHRIAAYLVDIVIITIIVAIILSLSAINIITLVQNPFGSVRVNIVLLIQFFMLSLVVALVLFSYYTLVPLRLNGQTIGKRMFRIRTVNIDGTSITFMTIFVREIVGRMFINYATFGFGAIISLIVTLYRKDRRAIHDVIANTIVIDN